MEDNSPSEVDEPCIVRKRLRLVAGHEGVELEFPTVLARSTKRDPRHRKIKINPHRVRPRRILILVCRSGNILDDNLWEGESPSVQPFENGVHLRFRAPVHKLGHERHKLLARDRVGIEVR